jgi:hypothetical protein
MGGKALIPSPVRERNFGFADRPKDFTLVDHVPTESCRHAELQTAPLFAY